MLKDKIKKINFKKESNTKKKNQLKEWERNFT
jgi:hypothetical protein